MAIVYATWDVNKKAADIGLSNGNLTAKRTIGQHPWKAVLATQGKSSGKWYFEVQATNNISVFGFGTSAMGVDRGADHAFPGYDLSANTSWGHDWRFSDRWYMRTVTSVLFPVAGLYRVKVDLDAGNIYVALNGGAFDSDPLNAASLLGLTIYPAVGLYYNTTSFTANFGASSFVYSVPDGYNPGWYDLGLTKDLLAYYNCNELTGDGKLLDSSGNNAHGTMYGAALTTDAKVGTKALFCDGIDDRVEISQAYFTSLTDKFTLNFWVKFLQNGTGVDGVVWKGGPGSGGQDFIVYINNNTTPAFRINNTGTQVSGSECGLVYRMVTCKYDGINLYLKIDNGNWTSIPRAAGNIGQTGDVCLGAVTGGVQQAMVQLDAIGFWKRVLFDSEITQLWNSGSGLALGTKNVLYDDFESGNLNKWPIYYEDSTANYAIVEEADTHFASKHLHMYSTYTYITELYTLPLANDRYIKARVKWTNVQAGGGALLIRANGDGSYYMAIIDNATPRIFSVTNRSAVLLASGGTPFVQDTEYNVEFYQEGNGNLVFKREGVILVQVINTTITSGGRVGIRTGNEVHLYVDDVEVVDEDISTSTSNRRRRMLQSIGVSWL